MAQQPTAKIEGDGTTAQLCEWTNKLSLSDVPKPVIERAKHLILDGLACGLVGARVPWSEQLVASVAAYEPHGKCSIIGHEEVCASNTFEPRPKIADVMSYA